MIRKVVAFLVLLQAASLFGAEPTIVVMTDGSIYYSDGSGSEAVLVTNVVRIPGGNGPTPPIPKPPPDNPTGVKKLAKELADKVNDPVGAKIMASTYGLIGDKIADGTIPSDAGSVDKALTAAADKAIGIIPGDKEDEWEDVHDELADDLSKRIVQAAGKLPKSDYVQWFGDVEAGLEQSSQGASFPSFLDPLIEVLIQVLIELITNLFK